MKRLARFTFATDLAADFCPKAVHPDEIVAAKRAGRHCLYLTMNGVPLRQQWESVRDELRLIRIFHQLGVRMMHLTYNRRNPIGDGVGEPNDGGLSDFGHAVVAEMNRLGVIVDVSHSGWRTSLEAARASRRPMVASHTTCGGVYSHFRGKPDEVIRAICDTGGLVGICCISRFLGGDGDIRTFLNHIDYLVKKFGADHVAIGTDVAYTSRHDGTERAKVRPRKDGRSPLAVAGPRWEHLWPVDNFRVQPQAEQSLAWTNWPLFTVGLVQRGHSEETIRKILGENVLRVARANWLGVAG
jgi:membrane dipeptidase